ncbi:MAG: adenine phosphoribosyltransferase [Bacteroidales bacterium]|jgi:adenine phosphoribosyltransferase|nr:adenine phosphoribosyltransferase [Bacteroidales bacterium]
MKVSDIDFLKGFIRTIEDYPIKGVSFKDISPLLANVKAMKTATECLVKTLPTEVISSVMAVESRGFIFGSVLSVVNNAPFIMIRKAAKLPPVDSNVFFNSKSEYASEKLGFNSSFLSKGIILLHDDVLATGGTSKSVIEALVEQCGIDPSKIYLSFLVELSFLKGKDFLLRENIIPEKNIKSVLVY